MANCSEAAADKHHYVFQCAVKYNAWQAILCKYTSKTDWPDDELHAILSFQRPSFTIRPASNITASQLITCCVIGISTTINTRFLSDHSISEDKIITIITREIEKLVAQNNYRRRH